MPVTMVELPLYPVPVRHGLLPGLSRRASSMQLKMHEGWPPHSVLPRTAEKGMVLGQLLGATHLAMAVRMWPSNEAVCSFWISWTCFRHSRSFTALGFQRTLMLPKQPGTGEIPVAINLSLPPNPSKSSELSRRTLCCTSLSRRSFLSRSAALRRGVLRTTQPLYLVYREYP